MHEGEATVPELPWTIEADLLHLVHGISLDQAIDLVSIRYLKHGDTRALAWFLREGHLPLDRLCEYLSGMLAPGDIPLDRLPFELRAVSRSGKRGRRPSPERELRDWLIFKAVRAEVERQGPGSYDAAIRTVSELQGLEAPTVKRAYECLSKFIDRASDDK